MIELLFLILMMLAWGIGGEPHFGKWKRGALLCIPMTILGVFNLEWHRVLLQIPLLLALYQIMIPSKLAQSNVWGDKEKKNPVLGWLMIALNGVIYGITPLMFCRSILDVIVCAIVGAIAWCLIMYVSNEPKLEQYRINLCNSFSDLYLYKCKCDDGSECKCGKLKDFWFLCECAMGLLLGVLTICINFVKK